MRNWLTNNWTYCIPGILFLLAIMILPYACPSDSQKENNNNDNIKIEDGN
jgi:hypothetical protein